MSYHQGVAWADGVVREASWGRCISDLEKESRIYPKSMGSHLGVSVAKSFPIPFSHPMPNSSCTSYWLYFQNRSRLLTLLIPPISPPRFGSHLTPVRLPLPALTSFNLNSQQPVSLSKQVSSHPYSAQEPAMAPIPVRI